MKRFLTGAALATSVCFAQPSQAALTSNVVGASSFEPMYMSTISGDDFDLTALDLALGPLYPPHVTETETILGTFADSHTESMTVTVGYGFKPYAIGWAGLTSVAFGTVPPGYLAFDNISYATGPGGAAVVDFEDLVAGALFSNHMNSGGMKFDMYQTIVYGPKNPLDFPMDVPEPATWAMMLVGCGGIGAMIRRRRALVAA